MRRTHTAVLILALAAGPLHAADNGIYVGAALSRSNIETEADFFGFDFGDRDTAYKLIGGVRPFDALAFEVNYVDFGSIVFDERDLLPDGFRGEFETQALDAFAMAHLGGPLLEGFGKLGVVFWDAEATLQGGLAGIDLRDSDSGVDLAWGGGLQASFGSLAVRLEYENFSISEADKLELWSLGVTWTFL